MKKLTPREAQFVGEYLADPELNGGRAYERAGYKARGAAACVGASRLLRKAKVVAAIEKAQKERVDRLQVPADSVVRRLDEVADRCMQAAPVIGKDGEPTGTYRFDSSGANRALELLGRHLGMFLDRVQHEGDPERPVQIRDQLDERTRREIADLEHRISVEEGRAS